METMIELTVVFENPAITPLTFLTGPFVPNRADDDGEFWRAIADLRDQAQVQLGDAIPDDRCFYRFFRRDV